MIPTLLILAVVLLLGWGWFSSNLILAGRREPVSVLPSSFGLNYEKISFVTADSVMIKGWFVPAQPQASPSPDRKNQTVIVCHGWGANKSDIVHASIFLNTQGGFNLMYFDFRNHGESAGNKTTLGALELRDLEAAYQFLQDHKTSQAQWVGVHGFSMGGAVALIGAAHIPGLKAVVAESAPASFSRVVKRYARIYYHLPSFPAVTLAFLFARLRLAFNPDRYSSERHIHKIAPRPIFLIHGLEDIRMPPDVGRHLFSLAGEPKTLWEVPDAHHGEVYVMAQQEYEQRVLAFFNQSASTP